MNEKRILMKKDSSIKNSSPKSIPSPSFVKLAMRNMVKKGSQSLLHFGLTAIGFVSFVILLAVLGRPNLP